MIDTDVGHASHMLWRHTHDEPAAEPMGDEHDHALAHEVWVAGELPHTAAPTHPRIRAPHAAELVEPTHHSTAA
jgi:hypothetical protein